MILSTPYEVADTRGLVEGVALLDVVRGNLQLRTLLGETFTFDADDEDLELDEDGTTTIFVEGGQIILKPLTEDSEVFDLIDGAETLEHLRYWASFTK